MAAVTNLLNFLFVLRDESSILKIIHLIMLLFQEWRFRFGNPNYTPSLSTFDKNRNREVFEQFVLQKIENCHFQ